MLMKPIFWTPCAYTLKTHWWCFFYSFPLSVRCWLLYTFPCLWSCQLQCLLYFSQEQKQTPLQQQQLQFWPKANQGQWLITCSIQHFEGPVLQNRPFHCTDHTEEKTPSSAASQPYAHQCGAETLAYINSSIKFLIHPCHIQQGCSSYSLQRAVLLSTEQPHQGCYCTRNEGEGRKWNEHLQIDEWELVYAMWILYSNMGKGRDEIWGGSLNLDFEIVRCWQTAWWHS